MEVEEMKHRKRHLLVNKRIIHNMILDVDFGMFFSNLVMVISLIVGLLINYMGISPIQALIYTAILYGITSPILIAVIMHISNNKKIMGKYTNGYWSNLLGMITLILMTLSAICLLYLYLVG